MTVTGSRPSYRGFHVEVVEAVDLSPTFRRLTFTGADLDEFGDSLLDQRIKLILATPLQLKRWPPEDTYTYWRALPDAERPAMRTYTAAGIDHDRRLLTVDIACRPVHGPASAFAASAKPGAPLVVLGPDRLSEEAREDGIAWRPGNAHEVLIVGDETALPAVRNIVRSLPETTRGHVVVEVPTIGDAVDLPIPMGVDLKVVMRSGRPGASAQRAVRAWSDSHPVSDDSPDNQDADGDLIWDEVDAPTERRYGWIAGEAGGVVAMRRELIASEALSRASANFMGYWRVGRSEST